MKYKSLQTISKYLHIFHNNFHNKREKLTLEHIIPRSFCKKNCKLIKDPRNLILYPKKVNNHRSNYELVNHNDNRFIKNINKTIFLNQQGEKININDNQDILYLFFYSHIRNDKKIINQREKYNEKYLIKNNNERIFTPPKYYKGIISRSLIELMNDYSYIKDIVEIKVCKKETIREWEIKYPICEYEKERTNFIKKDLM